MLQLLKNPITENDTETEFSDYILPEEQTNHITMSNRYKNADIWSSMDNSSK